MSIICDVLAVVGVVLIGLGAFCDLVASIGVLRLRDFYQRMHALTIGTIGGCVVPLVGLALLAAGYPELGYARWFIAGVALVSAVMVLTLGPTGSHALARAAYRSCTAKPTMLRGDHLDEDKGWCRSGSSKDS